MAKKSDKSVVFSNLPHFFDKKKGEYVYLYGNDDPATEKQMWQSTIAGVLVGLTIVTTMFLIIPCK